MTPQDQAKLELAAGLVDQVLENLDVTFSTCECCSLNKYTNKVEWQQSNELTAIATKLRRMSAGGRR